MTLGDAYEKYSGLVFPEHITTEDKFSERGQMPDFNPDGLLVDQWDDLMAVRNENKTVAYFLRKLHRVWGELGESQIDEVAVMQSPDLARTNLSKKQAGAQNVLRIQELVGADSTGVWDQQTPEAAAMQRYPVSFGRNEIVFYFTQIFRQTNMSGLMSGPRGCSDRLEILIRE